MVSRLILISHTGNTLPWLIIHYNDVIMGEMTYQITSLTIVYSIVYSDADQRKYQSSASLAFVRGIHRGPVNSPHKWPVKRKMFPFDDVIMIKEISLSSVAFRAWISHPLKPWNIIIHKQKNTHISIKKIYFQEKFINDQTEIANTFNDFFINIGPNLTKNIIKKIIVTFLTGNTITHRFYLPSIFN